MTVMTTMPSVSTSSLAHATVSSTGSSSWRAATPWRGWLLSGGIHVAFLSAFSGVCWLFTVEVPTAPLRTTILDVPPSLAELEDGRPSTATIVIDLPPDVLPPAVLEQAVEEPDLGDDDAAIPRAPGLPDAVSDAACAGPAAFLSLGAGNGAAGLFGQRSAHGRKRAVAHGGATIASENAVESALRWFKRHQRGDGWWDHGCWLDRKDASAQASTIPGPQAGVQAGATIAGQPDPDARGTVAYTGLALLCFLGAGYDHRVSGPYTATVARGLQALLRVQRPTGGFSGGNYVQAIAAMALIEAYGMSHDSELEGPARRACEAVLVKQNHQGTHRSGWDYGGPTEREDTSVTGWNVQALTSAAAAGLGSRALEDGIGGARGWIERVWTIAKPEWRFPYAVEHGGKLCPGTGSLNGVAVTCAYILGGARDPRMIDPLSDAIASHVPLAYPCNTYALYYDTVALFHVGGRRWSHWNESVRDLLVHAQSRGDDGAGGSWVGDDTYCGGPQGRVLATALCCLSLEVYYRYARALPTGALPARVGQGGGAR